MYCPGADFCLDKLTVKERIEAIGELKCGLAI